jgi:uncharacterized membrane protein YeaQ/YmgE (transglycosylase-associated protein family)
MMVGFLCLEHDINPYIWCAVGGLVGWLAVMQSTGSGRVAVVENLLVGVFGAFIGGDFVAAMLNGGVVDDKVFKVGSLAMAIAGAVVLLLMLRLMQRVVGPLQAGKAKPRHRL